MDNMALSQQFTPDSTMANESIALKIVFGNEIRRFALEKTSYSNLLDNICKLFALVPSGVRIGYIDEEGDNVRISSDSELQFAIKHCAGKLRMIVSLLEPPVMPSAPQFEVPQYIPPVAPVLHQSYQPTSDPSFNNAAYSQGFDPSTEKKRREHEWKKEKKEWKREKRELKKMHKYAKDDNISFAEELHPLKFNSLRLVNDYFIVANNRTEEFKLKTEPGIQFTKVWRIRNESGLMWSHSLGWQFSFQKGDAPALNLPTIVALPKDVAPQEEFDIILHGTAPKQFGKYVCVYRMSTPASKKLFGQPLKIVIKVREPEVLTPEVKEMLGQLHQMGFRNDPLNKRLIKQNHGSLEAVVNRLANISVKQDFKQH